MSGGPEVSKTSEPSHSLLVLESTNASVEITAPGAIVALSLVQIFFYLNKKPKKI